MIKDQLYKELKSVSALRTSRQKFANRVLEDINLVEPLIDLLFINDKKISPRAAWILEFAFKDNYKIILPYFDIFISNISELKLDSSIRPCAKIIEILIDLYYNKMNPEIRQTLTQTHKSQITETCFDWMITEQKVAVKAYSMNILYDLGTEYNWIHPELRTIMQRDYTSQTAGYKARTRHILEKIKKRNS
ncbi:adenylosuccinate lyase [Winogradskyella litorisediminis]|uniref:Adenylosuccinate lyase n=1 Tax=Winogradskyella litorisediminis TaxID=1156618 RepID=A0ABW3NA10_9FLAO